LRVESFTVTSSFGKFGIFGIFGRVREEGFFFFCSFCVTAAGGGVTTPEKEV